MDGFYITLPSNVKNPGATFENKTSHYITPLIRPLHLEPAASYECALVEISFPYTWYTFSEQDDKKFSFARVLVHARGSFRFYDNTLEQGYYPKIESIMEAIWDKKPPEMRAKYRVLPFSKKIEITLYKDELLIFNSKLAGLLGFNHHTLGPVTSTEDKLFVSDHPAELYPHYNIFVYTDLVEPSLVGDTEASLLAVVPVGQAKEWGTLFFKEILNPQYYPVNKPIVSHIETKLLTEFGELVQFQHGKSIIKLHVRRRRPRLS